MAVRPSPAAISRVIRAYPGAVSASVVGLLVRLVWVAVATSDPGEYPTDGATYLRMARELARGDAPTIGGLPTAFFPPGYPALLAPLARLTDASGAPSLVFAATLLNAVLGAATVAVIAALATRVFSKAAGTAAGWLIAVYPAAVFMTANVMAETLFTLIVGLVVLVTWEVAGRSAGRTGLDRRFVVVGALIGAAALTRGPGIVLLLVPALAVRSRSGSWRGALRPTVAALLGAAVLLVPWTIRNGVQVGVWTPLSTNTATALCAGHRDRADGRWVETPAMLVECLRGSPWDNRAIIDPLWIPEGIDEEARRRGVEMGTPDEADWYPRTVRRSLGWAITHPADEVRLTARKAYHLFKDDADPQYLSDRFRAEHPAWSTVLVALGNAWYWIIVAAAGFAMVRFGECRRAVIIWGTGAVLAASALVAVAYPQFRLPAMPMVVVLAAVSVSRGVTRLGWGSDRGPGADGRSHEQRAPSNDEHGGRIGDVEAGDSRIATGSRTRRTFELVRVLAPRELRVRYRQSFLDVTWAVISPVAILAVYGTILTQSFSVGGSCAPYLTSAWTGMVVWTFFATAVGGGVSSLIASADLMGKLYFPREALPLSVTGSALADLGVGMVSLFGLMLVQGVRPGWRALLVVLPLLLVVLWSAALSVLTAVLAAFVRDVVHAVNLLLRVGFFAVPVLYEVGYLPAPLAWTARVNPLTVAITEMRNLLYCDVGPSPNLLPYHLVVAALALVAVIRYTRAVESRIVDVI